MNKTLRTIIILVLVALIAVAGIVFLPSMLAPKVSDTGDTAAEATPTVETEPTAEPVAEVANADATVTPDTIDFTAIDPATVIAKVNGEEVTAKQALTLYDYMISYYTSSGYDVSSDASKNQIRGDALKATLENALELQKANEMGIVLSDEEKGKLEEEYNSILSAYEQSLIAQIETPTDEDKAQAKADTLAAAQEQDFTLQSVFDQTILQRLFDELTKDVKVTDEEVQAHYDEIVAGEKELYQNDFSSYEMAGYFAQMGYGSAPIYLPAGIRGIKHILLPVSDELKAEYQAATAVSEEALDETEPVDENATPETAPEATEEPTPTRDIDTIKADMIASVQTTVDEITEKIAAGASFDDLVVAYGQDPGMTVEPNKSQGYYLHLDSQMYDPAFKAAAFERLEKIGDVSGPVAGASGVHILYYAMDIPEGAPALTDEARESYRSTLLGTQSNTAFYAKIDEMMAQANIEYVK